MPSKKKKGSAKKNNQTPTALKVTQPVSTPAAGKPVTPVKAPQTPVKTPVSGVSHSQFAETPKGEEKFTDANFWARDVGNADELSDLDDDDNTSWTNKDAYGNSSVGTVNVVVGSTNPTKINSVKQAFEELFPKKRYEVVGVSAASGVSDQPMTETETKTGATNRATNAIAAIKKSQPNFVPHYAVGLEGGLTSSDNGAGLYDCFAWMAVCEVAKNKFSYARTASFTLPKQVCDLVSQGMELGHADDVVFKRSNSKESSGTVGILTHGKIDRTCYYKHALTFALVPILNPELY